jgi:hypothetical protein
MKTLTLKTFQRHQDLWIFNLWKTEKSQKETFNLIRVEMNLKALIICSLLVTICQKTFYSHHLLAHLKIL